MKTRLQCLTCMDKWFTDVAIQTDLKWCPKCKSIRYVKQVAPPHILIPCTNSLVSLAKLSIISDYSQNQWGITSVLYDCPDCDGAHLATFG